MWLAQAWCNFSSTRYRIVGWQSFHRHFAHHLHSLLFIQVLWRKENIRNLEIQKYQSNYGLKIVILRVHLTAVADIWAESVFESSQKSIFPVYCCVCLNGLTVMKTKLKLIFSRWKLFLKNFSYRMWVFVRMFVVHVVPFFECMSQIMTEVFDAMCGWCRMHFGEMFKC